MNKYDSFNNNNQKIKYWLIKFSFGIPVEETLTHHSLPSELFSYPETEHHITYIQPCTLCKLHVSIYSLTISIYVQTLQKIHALLWSDPHPPEMLPFQSHQGSGKAWCGFGCCGSAGQLSHSLFGTHCTGTGPEKWAAPVRQLHCHAYSQCI